MLGKDVPLGTRRALSLYKVYGDGALLVLNETLLNIINTLLVLNGTSLNIINTLLVLNGTSLNIINTLLVLNGTSLNIINALLALSRRYTVAGHDIIAVQCAGCTIRFGSSITKLVIGYTHIKKINHNYQCNQNLGLNINLTTMITSCYKEVYFVHYFEDFVL